MNKNKYQLHFILLNPTSSKLEEYLKENNFQVDRITYNSKKDIPIAIIKTYRLLRKNKTTLVHTHLFDANIVGLTAAWLARIKKRIHSRHHSDYHHTYYPKAVKYDIYINWLSTDIVAISEVVKNILINKEGVPESKISLIHHGFKLNLFADTDEDIVNELRKIYNAKQASPVIGVISRYLELKGIQYIIPAFKKLLDKHPDALLILANANGNYKEEIKQLLKTIPSKNYIEITFESNIFVLYKLFNVFLHVPVAKDIEAFGQTYVEALAAGIPSIFTLSGIANEFIVDKQNALVVQYRDTDAIYDSIMELISNKALAEYLIINGKNDVKEKFDINKMILSLEKLYDGR